MNSRIRYAAISLLGVSLAAMLLLVFPNVSGSRAKARAVVPAADLTAGTTARPLNIVPSPSPTPDIILARVNYALASLKAKASASSATSGYDPKGAIDGDRKGLNFGKDGYWNSKDVTFPQWLEVDFNGRRMITEIYVFTIQDNYASPVEPDQTMEFKLYGLTDFDVEYWSEWTGVPLPGGTSGGFWIPIPGGSRRENKLVWNLIDFSKSPITTSKIRVKCLGSRDNFSRIAELEAWSK
jgi:hypothetical protein